MKIITNNKTGSNLVVMLHGLNSDINSILMKSIFQTLRVLGKKVILFEFSYVGENRPPDPDQITEAKELIKFLEIQKYRNLTVIGHSNGGFIGIVAVNFGLKVDHFIFLGVSSIQKKRTGQIIAKILKKNYPKRKTNNNSRRRRSIFFTQGGAKFSKNL